MSPAEASSAVDAELMAKIDAARDLLLNGGQPRSSLAALEELEATNLASASPRAKFRLLTNLGPRTTTSDNTRLLRVCLNEPTSSRRMTLMEIKNLRRRISLREGSLTRESRQVASLLAIVTQSPSGGRSHSSGD